MVGIAGAQHMGIRSGLHGHPSSAHPFRSSPVTPQLPRRHTKKSKRLQKIQTMAGDGISQAGTVISFGEALFGAIPSQTYTNLGAILIEVFNTLMIKLFHRMQLHRHHLSLFHQHLFEGSLRADCLANEKGVPKEEVKSWYAFYLAYCASTTLLGSAQRHNVSFFSVRSYSVAESLALQFFKIVCSK